MTRHENDRLLAAARAIAQEPARMTTPLGTLDVREREARRVRVARRTRETDITIELDLDGTGPRRRRDRRRLLRPPPLRPSPTTGCSTSRSAPRATSTWTSTTRSRTSALVLGAAFAEALGDRAGIRRFGDSAVPMDESVATAVVDIGGRPYAVIDLPFRAERAGALPLQLVDHALESFARTAGATLHLRGHRPQRPPPGEAAFKALGRALRVRVRAGSAPDRRRLHQGLARVSDRRAPVVVVVDYGAGNLVSIEQALAAAGARVRLAATGGGDRRRGPARRAGRRGRGPRDGAPARGRLRRADPRPGSRPTARSSASASGSSCCSRAATRTARRRWGSCPAGRSASSDAPTLPHIGWNQVVRRREHPAFDGHRRRRGLLLRPLVRRARRPGREDEAAILADTGHGTAFVSAVARRRLLGVQFHPERSGANGLAAVANVGPPSPRDRPAAPPGPRAGATRPSAA